MRWRRSPPTDAHGRCITLDAVLQIDHTELPFPLVECADSVEKLLLAMKPEVAELFGAGLTPEAVELLTLNLECEADSGIPAEKDVKDVIEIGQVQGIRHGDESDDHWVDVAKNGAENQSSKGSCWHPLRLR